LRLVLHQLFGMFAFPHQEAFGFPPWWKFPQKKYDSPPSPPERTRRFVPAAVSDLVPTPLSFFATRLVSPSLSALPPARGLGGTGPALWFRHGFPSSLTPPGSLPHRLPSPPRCHAGLFFPPLTISRCSFFFPDFLSLVFSFIFPPSRCSPVCPPPPLRTSLFPFLLPPFSGPGTLRRLLITPPHFRNCGCVLIAALFFFLLFSPWDGIPRSPPSLCPLPGPSLRVCRDPFPHPIPIIFFFGGDREVLCQPSVFLLILAPCPVFFRGCLTALINVAARPLFSR